MKKISSLLIALVALATMNAQAQDAKAIRELDKKTDLLLDSAAKHMVHFILSKDETEYDRSLLIAKEAQKSNIALDSLSKTTHKSSAKEINGYVVENIAELTAYDDPAIKTVVLSDTDKSQKVTFKSKKYMIGKPSKDLYYKFIEFLPAN